MPKISKAVPEVKPQTAIIPEPVYTLPDAGFVREKNLLPIIGVSHATLWRYVKAGTFPQPIHLSVKVVAWRVSDVRAWLAGFGEVAA